MSPLRHVRSEVTCSHCTLVLAVEVQYSSCLPISGQLEDSHLALSAASFCFAEVTFQYFASVDMR